MYQFFFQHTLARKCAASLLIFLTSWVALPAPLVFAAEVVETVTEAVEATVEEEEEVEEVVEEEPEEVEEEAVITEAEEGEEGEVGETGEAGETGEEATDETQQTAPDGEGGEAGEGTEASEDGEAGDETTSTTPADDDVVIETGDSVSVGDIATGANTNVTNTQATTTASSSGTSGGSGGGTGGVLNEGYDSVHETASTTEQTGTSTTASSTDYQAERATSTTTEVVTADNAATSTTDAEFIAGSGGNSAAAVAGDAIVRTGNSITSANVINVVNTNIVDSEGLMLFLSSVYGTEAVDLRDSFSIFDINQAQTAQSTCSLISCTSDVLMRTIESDNDATIDNDVVVRSETGDNYVFSIAGDAVAMTGDAYASANLLNVANTNLVDSNYLLVAMNNFGDLSNDIVFPGMEFFQQMAGQKSLSNLTLQTNNTATVGNTIGAVADTGANAATAGGQAVIGTGEAHTGVNVVNEINQNYVNSDSFYMLIRVFGDWNGDVFGLPEGFTWAQTSEGIVIMSEGSDGAGAIANAGSATAIATKNNAKINNNVQVYALTGDNKVESQNGNAVALTGDAYAGANVVNVANTNVLGSNWMRAVFNIFGDWNGNLTFGRPDLWVGGRAQAMGNDFAPGDSVEYTFTVTNFGDTPASNVILTPEALSPALLDAPARLSLGNLAAGESREVSFQSRIAGRGQLLDAQAAATMKASVSARESEDDLSNNTEEVTITVLRDLQRIVGKSVFRHADSNIIVEKNLLSEGRMMASSTAKYEVTIKNRGSKAYHTILHDTLFNEDGKAIHKQIWELDTIQAGEEIYITYDVFFKGETKPGLYRNEVYVEGINKHPSLEVRYGSRFQTDPAEATVRIIADPNEPEVLGEATTKVCEAYLNHYIEYGKDNNPVAVAKLQQFLNTYEGESLAITGAYNYATYRAVHRFQKKYASDILYPWNVTQSTGYVYFTTQKKVNDLYCKGSESFPLSPEQVAEIDTFKAKLEEHDAVDVDVEMEKVGYTPEPVPYVVAPTPASIAGVKAPAGQQPIAPTVPTSVQAMQSPNLLDRVRERLTNVMRWFTYHIDWVKTAMAGSEVTRR